MTDPIPMSTPPAQASSSEHRGRLTVLAATSSSLVLLIQIIRWPLVDLITPFLEPLVEVLIYATFLVATLVCLVHGLRRRRQRSLRLWLPFVLCAVTAVVLYLTPFDSLYLKANFRIFERRRTNAAQLILAGKAGTLVRTGGRGDSVALPSSDNVLSAGGGEVLVDHAEGKSFVLFFTFRGILDRFSGYVYSPTDDPPARDQFLGDGIEIERVAPHWFWYSS